MTFRSLALTGIILASTLGLGTARAQGGLNAMLSIPMGDFSDGASPVGFGATLEGNARMNDVVGWVTGGSFIFNASDKSDVPSGMDVSGGNAITIPALTGLRLTGAAQNNLKVYVQGQAGITLFMITDMTASGGGGSSTFSTDPNIHLGFGGGLGLIMNDKVNIGFRFFGTPEMEMSGHASSSSGGSADAEGTLTVSMLQINLGVIF